MAVVKPLGFKVAGDFNCETGESISIFNKIASLNSIQIAAGWVKFTLHKELTIHMQINIDIHLHFVSSLVQSVLHTHDNNGCQLYIDSLSMQVECACIIGSTDVNANKSVSHLIDWNVVHCNSKYSHVIDVWFTETRPRHRFCLFSCFHLSRNSSEFPFHTWVQQYIIQSFHNRWNVLLQVLMIQ